MQNQSLQQTMRGCSKVVGCMISDLHSSSDLVLKGCCMLAESQQKTARLYRHSQHMLEMGLVSVVIFGLMGVGSVTAAILNVDGSFRNPILAACIFGGFWGCLCLVGLWMILIYYRHELHIDSGNVSHRGGLMTGSVCLSRLTCATWKSFTGCLTLHDGSGRHDTREHVVCCSRGLIAGKDPKRLKVKSVGLTTSGRQTHRSSATASPS